jgi:Ca-activated chloride channel family protein
MAIEFARPDILSLLLILPVWWLLIWPWPGSGVLFARGESTRPHAGRWGARGAMVLLAPRLLRTAIVISLVAALAEPQRVEPVEEQSLAGKGIALAVDLSSSMLAEDMDDGRSRIDLAREAAVRFAAGRTHDELTLVGFARDALTRIPPTTDPEVVVAGVESLEVQLVGDGTDIADALLTAVGRLLQSDREPRVVILLTDGAHNGTGVRPLAAARAAAALDVKVHAISVLPPEDPLEAAARRLYYRGADPTTEMRTVLGGIADLTGGEYFHASSAAALDSIYREIDRLEAPVEVVTGAELRHPLRLWFILAGLLIVGGESLLRGSRWGVIP